MCLTVAVAGIFAYLNFLTPRRRSEIIEILLNGLKRLEYRGYDSAGLYTTSGGGLCGTDWARLKVHATQKVEIAQTIK